MKEIVNQFSQEEIEILRNEFIVVSDNITKENLHIELLKYLRGKSIKIINPEYFNQLYESIEGKNFVISSTDIL